jgi:hypothetical protein
VEIACGALRGREVAAVVRDSHSALFSRTSPPGDSAEHILADFPTLKPEDIRAAMAFAVASAEADLPAPAIPHV